MENLTVHIFRYFVEFYFARRVQGSKGYAFTISSVVISPITIFEYLQLFCNPAKSVWHLNK